MEMARKLELSRSYLSEMENGKKDPSLEILDKYAKIFEIRTSTILLLREDYAEMSGDDTDKAFSKKLLERVSYDMMR